MLRPLGITHFALGLALFATACGPSAPDLPAEIEGYGLTVERDRLAPTLRVFNFPDYLDAGLIRAFREEYGVRIVQDFFDTNEAMLARLQAGGTAQFDLVVASDYAVQILRGGEMIAPLDPTLLPNRANLHPDFMGLPYDPENRYSVPYQWGTTGIGLRADRVEGDEDRWASWGVLFDPTQSLGRFALLDDPRESVGAALLYLGYSVNSTDDAELAEAETLLVNARDRAVAFTPATTGRDLLVAGELDVSHNHSGDVAVAQEESTGITYLIPREGAVIWADNMVIPAGSRAAYTAHVFMNFLLDAENGARLTEEIRYASPNQAAWPLLDEELREQHERFVEGGILGGDGSGPRLEFIRDVGEDRRKFDQLWTRVKAGAGR